MKGTWQGSGTWETGGPGAAPVLAVVAGAAVIGAAEWVFARRWWILGGTAAAAAVAAYAVWRLFRWADRRDAVRGARLYAGRLTAVPPAITASAPRQLEPRIVNVYITAADGDTAARVIRAAIPGQAGDAISERK